MICPNCGHKHVSTRKPKSTVYQERPEIDRAFLATEIDQAEYFKQCKRIALRDDIRFLIKVAGYDLAGLLRIEAYDLLEQLEKRPATADDSRQINTIRDRYRVSRGSLVVIAGSPESLRLAAERERIELARIEAKERDKAERDARVRLLGVA